MNEPTPLHTISLWCSFLSTFPVYYWKEIFSFLCLSLISSSPSLVRFPFGSVFNVLVCSVNKFRTRDQTKNQETWQWQIISMNNILKTYTHTHTGMRDRATELVMPATITNERTAVVLSFCPVLTSHFVFDYRQNRIYDVVPLVYMFSMKNCFARTKAMSLNVYRDAEFDFMLSCLRIKKRQTEIHVWNIGAAVYYELYTFGRLPFSRCVCIYKFPWAEAPFLE